MCFPSSPQWVLARALSIDDDAPVKVAAEEVSASETVNIVLKLSPIQIARRLGGVTEYSLYVDDAE